MRQLFPICDESGENDYEQHYLYAASNNKLLPLLLQLLLQIPAARTTSENKFQNAETPTIATSPPATTTNSQTTTIARTASSSASSSSSYNNKNKNNMTTRELRKHEQIIDNSIDFTVDPCDDFYQYACGEWKHQLYDHDADHDEVLESGDAADLLKNIDNTAAESVKYDRTLALIDYLADKEVLKYFNARSLTKKLNTPQTPSAEITTTTATTTTTTTTASSATVTAKTTTTTTATKEPDFIIKVYKYYKSCIAMQQYEPIKYLEWLELNEHVKWPSLINTTTATNSEEQDHQNDAPFTTADLEEEDGITVANHYDDDNDNDADVAAGAERPTQDHNSSWLNTLAILRKYGLNGIFIEEIIYSTKTFPSKLLLGFDKPIKEGGFKSLKSEHLKIVLESLNVNFTSDSFKHLWLQVTKFEWQLTKLNDISDELGTSMITLEHLPVPWLNDYLRIILNQTADAPLDSNMRLVITNVAYFMALDDLLNEYDDKFLQKYLQIRFLWQLYQREPQQFQPLDCILHIKHYMPLAFEWMYEQQRAGDLLPEIPKLHEMYNNLRKQFNLTLYNNKNNFDSAALERFVKKLETIQFKVGTFMAIDQAEFFHENRKFYSRLKFSSHEFYFNHMKMLKFNFDALHFGMRSINTNSLYYEMQEYNEGLASAPYFNRRLSTLHIPLSLLQPPIYHKEFADVYKYSTLGFLLAQTLMYGFNLKSLAVTEHEKLMQHVNCLQSLDATQMDDKIADVSGIRLAYHTFFHTTNKNLISNRKKFFLNFAQTFCGSPSLDDMLGRSQVNYGLAQFSEFSKTFQCAPDSHMHPHEKCYLWD